MAQSRLERAAANVSFQVQAGRRLMAYLGREPKFRLRHYPLSRLFGWGIALALPGQFKIW
jgi:hypothetical protein